MPSNPTRRGFIAASLVVPAALPAIDALAMDDPERFRLIQRREYLQSKSRNSIGNGLWLTRNCRLGADQAINFAMSRVGRLGQRLVDLKSMDILFKLTAFNG
jgi:hypothetical protein